MKKNGRIRKLSISGHCVSDESEPQLYRYKEECEDSCINNTPGMKINFQKKLIVANLGEPKSEQTYGTAKPLQETPTVPVKVGFFEIRPHSLKKHAIVHL